MSLKTIPSKKLFQAFPKKTAHIKLPKVVGLKDGYLNSEKEIKIIAKLCRLQNPKNIFEFGTFEGFTTLIFAMNSCEKTKICTLDLPRTNIPELKHGIDRNNKKYIEERDRTLFENTLYESKIKQIYEDSAALNTKPFKKKMDLIFIDGCHTYEYVKNDTEKAFEMIRKNGMIIWHDYNLSEWEENVKFIKKLSKTKDLYHIKGTCFVIFRN